jgi:hypothetical protein
MLTCLEIDIELSAAKSAHDNILESAQFLMREMADAPCDGEIRAKVLLWGNDFVARWTPVTASLAALTDKFTNYHRIHPSLIRSAVEAEADHLVSLVTQAMSKLDFQRSIPSDLTKINKAVSRIISGSSEIYHATEELVAFVRTDKIDPYNGMPYPHWEFNCKKCGKVALEVTIIPPDAGHPLQDSKEIGLMFASRKESEQEQQSLTASKFDAISHCLNKSDFTHLKDHTNAALTYCTTCKGIYCWSDWTNKYPIYNDSLYSHTDATCPEGHRQPIDD